ncbi:hypothetical protein XENTR_v10008233 [Xenopus tropicalis]|uniref:Interleukin 4 precursor n=1 Tax=Xenopus tropicalis TaxID=8364 RepID=A9JPI4_XENTR|nr:interleukin 4 precursor [Xenopus tropicalis]KAE8614594.1 hypothetical protein XENTR_v10008233 [Xenopus tropicalis]CAJ14377.1 interleukin-4 [Xenopus tropicalis]|eukprot:NP_001107279.1 interleukin 4 precursor [Xenopus tropicalis]
MSNLGRILCAVLGLFHLLSANPVPSSKLQIAIEEIISELVNNKITHKKCFVPTPYDDEEEASVEEISCRAFKSLKHVCASERKNLRLLNASLITMFSENVECSINNDEQKDLISVIEDLLTFFRAQMRKLVMNPKH